jgi:Putative beta-barrel porin 2
MKARFATIAALAVATLPLDASAQAWLSNRDFSEGVGIRAGNLELHPSIAGEFGYDSNFARSSKTEGVVDVLRLRVTPSITLSTLGSRRRNAETPPSVTFMGGAHAAYNEIIPLDSANSDVSKQRNLALGADARFDIFPQGKVGFDLDGGFVRAIEPNGNTDDLAHGGFNRDTVRGGAGASWRPGGGLFDWRLGYGITYNYFEQAAFSNLLNVQHAINTQGRWRFLPRSALMFDSSYTFVRYTGDQPLQTDGDVVRTRVGFRGLVTYHLAVLAMLGWASSFYDSRPLGLRAQNYDGLLANAELRWFISSAPTADSPSATAGLSSIALGYARTVDTSYLGSFYSRDRGYVQVNASLAGRLVSGVEFGVARVAYPESDYGAGDPAPAFDELRLDARAFGEYRFTDSFAMNLTFLYDKVNAGPARVHGEDLDYTRYQVFLGARLFW